MSFAGLASGLGGIMNATQQADRLRYQNQQYRQDQAADTTAGQAVQNLFAQDPSTGQITPLGQAPIPTGNGGASPGMPTPGAPQGPTPAGPPIAPPPIGGNPLASRAGAPTAATSKPLPAANVGPPGTPAAPQSQISLQQVIQAIKQAKPNISPQELWQTLNKFQPMMNSQDKATAEQLKLQLQQMRDNTQEKIAGGRNETNINIQGMKGDTAEKTTGMRDDTSRANNKNSNDTKVLTTGMNNTTAVTTQGMKGQQSQDLQKMKGEQKLTEIKARVAAAVKSGALTGAQKASITALQKRADAANQTVQSLIRSGTQLDDPGLQAAVKQRDTYMDQLATMITPEVPPALPGVDASATPPTGDAPSGVTVEEVK